ncbi:MAG: regulatory protein NosR [Rhodospirillales bacterium]|nr:regulatory protein NosR [Rhodospirillales bacterium]
MSVVAAWRRSVAVLFAALTLLAQPLPARELPGPDEIADIFPGATRIEPPSGEPPAARVLSGERLLGWLFYSHETVRSTGFSGRPLDVLVGLSADGTIAGARLVEHHEPILAIGIDEARLAAFIAQFKGRSIAEPPRVVAGGGPGAIDAISGATISSIVLDDAILRSARAVARSRGLLGAKAGALDLESFAPLDWSALVAEGSIAQLRIDGATLQRRMPEAESGLPPDGTFAELYLAPLAPARIGRNLLGDREYARLVAETPEGATPILVAGRGLYSFKGTSFARTGVFDRVQIVQGARSIALGAAEHRRLDRLAVAGAPELRELALFTLPPEAALDIADDWRLELLVAMPRRGGGESTAVFSLPYRLPGLYRSAAALPEPASLWTEVWKERSPRIALLALLLVTLAAILVFQDWIVKRPGFYTRLRTGFLVVTLLWLGCWAGAQLSVMNVLTFVNALLTGFRWDFFLLDPMLFILWSFVALAMLFWGRGVFCGWLCPFGALQDLIARAAKRLGLRQIRLPFLLHERLWPLKYIAFVGLLAITLGSLEAAQPWSEIEPFKTTIVLKFARAWPFVLYAVVLLAAGLFIERFFCRYLCPLGAALALPARQRLFEWLKRKRQCGTECQICAAQCPVQAIHPTGQINPSECIHCLGCQKLYYDDTTCPPLIERRKRREARRARTVAVIDAPRNAPSL